ncbi:histidine utilization repressor [Sphingomonas psychrotolerans]|uniref:Histidine utilization repressor n=1 Tax=Sphingomonas psychrotolerans TaxID=1327635 RepID=A0ABU3N3L4_9SPHN|nr:histidine utilization repressor [Sphingomonas psychrotolerans]MDT8758861.1 histidine utilization repressor [Sphingomonas psychrotolerans]
MTDTRPLYQVIRSAIEGRIMSGALRPGDRIPFEHELMAEYACSRMTVNKALSALANAGLIVRQRRRGSFVTQPRIHMAALQIPDIREEIEKRGHAYALRLVSHSIHPVDEAEAALLRLSPGRELLSLCCVHLADRRPFAVETRLINLAAVPDARHADFAAVPPGSWLLAHVPWTEAEHRITAAPANDAAELLDLEPNRPCLVLERWTWREAEAITYVRTAFDGDRFDLTAHFAAQG